MPHRQKLAASFAVAFVTPMMAVALLGPDAREQLGPTLRNIVHAVLHAPAGSSANGHSDALSAPSPRSRRSAKPATPQSS